MKANAFPVLNSSIPCDNCIITTHPNRATKTHIIEQGYEREAISM